MNKIEVIFLIYLHADVSKMDVNFLKVLNIAFILNIMNKYALQNETFPYLR